jgi:branched-subunit amino acid ABC-type transport system permease component
VLGLKAFAVAIIGGLTSGMGIIVGGIILGVARTTGYFHGLQGRARPGAAAGAGVQARRFVRQIGHQKV